MAQDFIVSTFTMEMEIDLFYCLPRIQGVAISYSSDSIKVIDYIVI